MATADTTPSPAAPTPAAERGHAWRHDPPALAPFGAEELWDAVGSDSEGSWLHTARVVYPDREMAERAVAALRQLTGAATMSLVACPGLRAPRLDVEEEGDAKGVTHGAMIGGAAGAAIGLVAAAIGALTLEPGVALALLGLAGLAFGGFVGAVVGLSLADPNDDDPVLWVHADEQAHLVTVRHLHAHRFRDLGERLGGVSIDPRTPLELQPGERTQVRSPEHVAD